jgi:hypothetical protein
MRLSFSGTLKKSLIPLMCGRENREYSVAHFEFGKISFMESEKRQQQQDREDSTSGTTPIELRRKVVADFARDVAEGRIYLSVDQTKWRPQDVELVSTTTSRLIRDLADYVSGAVAGEEYEFLEKQIFFSISVLRTYDALKTNLSESRVDEGIRRLETKIDLANQQLARILQVLAKEEKSLPAKEAKKKHKVIEKSPPEKPAGTAKASNATSEKVQKDRVARAESDDDDGGFF